MFSFIFFFYTLHSSLCSACFLHVWSEALVRLLGAGHAQDSEASQDFIAFDWDADFMPLLLRGGIEILVTAGDGLQGT